ncbi:MAG TPA: isoamylase early set domain-containing protein [Thermodesulfobacteriota bacterium]|nr:isoamylase early set domain-containing protein [Thermodesulfobacteriota bacterium]
MGLQKKYIKSGTVCKVTFSLSKEAAGDAKSVYLVGDFNNWDTDASPMKALKSGIHKVAINLESGNEYKFKYVIDGDKWENDWDADNYVPNEYGSEDSVVIV